ncbi:dihydroorotate dehydrogenase (quinone) [Listeria welshimeri]|uniref:dihydroorotate dehydrogenase (quinone) n=1 Tax=Listeria welshimeri TaxID=1643 RepID=UPI003CFFBC6F
MDNYYKGFEGNPEIDIYTFSKNKKVGIEMWDGYFDKIMSAVQPVNSEWTSLAYYYNLYEGWYDESPWEIPNNQEALKQFESIDKSTLDKVSREILTKIIELLKNNLRNSIFIEYT